MKIDISYKKTPNFANASKNSHRHEYINGAVENYFFQTDLRGKPMYFVDPLKLAVWIRADTESSVHPFTSVYAIWIVFIQGEGARFGNEDGSWTNQRSDCNFHLVLGNQA